MTTWDTGPVDDWTGRQYEYRRLTNLIVRCTQEGMQRSLIFIEDETDNLVLVDDPSFISAANRLGAGGWLIRPLSTESGEAPMFLMQQAWRHFNDLRPDGARWTMYWLTRERIMEELDEPEGIDDYDEDYRRDR